VWGTYMAVTNNFTPVYPIHVFGHTLPLYAGLSAFVLNIVVSIVLTVLFDLIGVARGTDQTARDDYGAEDQGAPVAAG